MVVPVEHNLQRILQTQDLHPILQTHYRSLSEAHAESRLKEYYSNPDVQARVVTVYVNALRNTVPKTAAVGGVLGLGVALVTGLSVSGTVLSVLKWSFGGAAVGAGYEALRLAIEIRIDQDYTIWKNGIDERILADFQAIIDHHQPFNDFRCLITLDFPTVPVRDRHGRLYDREAIHRWIDESGTNPCTREPMTREDVVHCDLYAAAFAREMAIAYGEIGHLLGQNRNEIIRGLQAAVGSAVKNHNSIVLEQARLAYNHAMNLGLGLERAHEVYLAASDDRLVHLPEVPKPEGLAAVLTIESIGDINYSLVPKVGGAVREVAREVMSQLVPNPHVE